MGIRRKKITDRRRENIEKLLGQCSPREVCEHLRRTRDQVSLSTIYKIRRQQTVAMKRKPDLKSGKMVEQQPKEATPEPRLMKHLDEVATTADILAHHAQRLIRYKDYDDIEAKGDVLSHLSFWGKSNRTKVTEGTDPIEEFKYETQHPVDTYLARCLYTHYDYRFGKPPFKEWNELSTGNVTHEIIDNLKLLAHGSLKPCPNCSICKEIMD